MPKRYLLTEASHLKRVRRRRREDRRQQREIETAIAELETLIAEIERDEARSIQQSPSSRPTFEPAELATALEQLSDFDLDEALTVFDSITNHDLDEILATVDTPDDPLGDVSINHPVSTNILSEPPAPPSSEIEFPTSEFLPTDLLSSGDILNPPLLPPIGFTSGNPTDIIEYPLVDFPPPQEVSIALSPLTNPLLTSAGEETSPVEILIRSFDQIIHQDPRDEDIIEFPLTRSMRFNYNL